ncbi:MAG: LysM peptidoglycan-binding domain-containing protein [Myxococcota bacterium]|nr:LysM peptidoglycan-binding domain-containing protein [Myxococcota bacterium]
MRALVAIALALGVSVSASGADETFPRPERLQPRVDLWKRVYSEVENDSGLLHDSEHLEVIYEVLHIPKALPLRVRERRVDAARGRYERVLRRLASGRRSGLSDEEQRVLALWPPGVSNKTLAAAARRVRFQRGQADRFRDGIVRSGAWIDEIERVLTERGLPIELSALPHVESSYNPRAYSKAGAAGVWQFTRSTGRLFMRIDYVVDERFDPHRATEAAAALLRSNYDRTGTWPLAITAYNHGTAGMERAVRKLGTRDIAEIVARYKSRTFGFASRNFYAEFLAALDVSREAERHFGPIVRESPSESHVVVTDAYYPADALARAFGIDVGLLQELNLPLRRPVWSGQKRVPANYPLRLPNLAERPPDAEVLATIPEAQRFAEQTRDRFHRVRRGDTLSQIARRYGVSQRSIMALNGLRNAHRIRVGQRLKLPTTGTPPARRTARGVPVEPAWVGTRYRVRRGETLSTIARRVGVPMKELAAHNGIRHPYRIRAGQVLKVPGSGT